MRAEPVRRSSDRVALRQVYRARQTGRAILPSIFVPPAQRHRHCFGGRRLWVRLFRLHHAAGYTERSRPARGQARRHRPDRRRSHGSAVPAGPTRDGRHRGREGDRRPERQFRGHRRGELPAGSSLPIQRHIADPEWHQPFYVDRVDLVRKLSQRIASGGDCILYGQKGVGKTALLSRVIESLPKHGAFQSFVISGLRGDDPPGSC